MLQDACHAEVGVDVLLGRDLVLRSPLETSAHADVKAFGVLPHRQKVDVARVLTPQGRQSIVVKLGGPEIHIEVELKAKAEQDASEIVRVIDAFIAHRAKEDRVSLGQLRPHLVCNGHAVAEVGVGIDVELLELEVGAGGTEHLDGLRHNLLPSSIAGQDGDLLAHEFIDCPGSTRTVRPRATMPVRPRGRATYSAGSCP